MLHYLKYQILLYLIIIVSTQIRSCGTVHAYVPQPDFDRDALMHDLLCIISFKNLLSDWSNRNFKKKNEYSLRSLVYLLQMVADTFLLLVNSNRVYRNFNKNQINPTIKNLKNNSFISFLCRRAKDYLSI